jgi:CheY-like chemotaxis protein
VAIFINNAMNQKLLLIDDDTRNIFALSAVLKTRGYEVLSASNMLEAFSLLNTQENIRVILIDMMMPGIDGYEATQLLRADPKFRDIPVIAVTAQAMKGDRERCLAAGVIEYVSKPVDIDLLLSHLQYFFNEQRADNK